MNASDRWTGPPGVDTSDEKPLWYLTSPSDVASLADVPSNSAKRSFGDLPSVLTSTFSRPRCAMPMTTSSTPKLPARWTISSMQGISVSPPSSEKRFWPTYRVCRYFSSVSAAVSRSRRRRFTSGVNCGRPRTASSRCWIQRFCAGSEMYMYSVPIVPQ